MSTLSSEEKDEAVKTESVEESARKQNHYAEHLAEVNKTTDVISTEDIFNENGLLVASSGTHINHSVANTIVQHKLTKSLEDQVKLENALTSKDLSAGIESLMNKYPDIKQIHFVHEFQETMEGLLSCNKIKPILFQDLTVMKECLPEHYEKTLFCSWLSSLIARELEMNSYVIESVFLAGLTRDLGLLHISGDIIKKEKDLTTDEWRAIQCHVVAGHLKIKKLGREYVDAARAVLEHHERCDGSGYPYGKTSEQLDIMGQIIAAADTIQAIRINKFAKSNRNMRDILPCLKMNKYMHFLKVYNAVCCIIYKSGLKPSCVNSFSDINALLSHLLVEGKKLQKAAVLLDGLLEFTESLCDVSECLKLLKVVRPVVITIRASGLVKKELIDWLESLQSKTSESVLKDLTDIELLQNELHWQLQNVCKVIDNSLDEGNSDNFTDEYKENLKSISVRINEILK